MVKLNVTKLIIIGGIAAILASCSTLPRYEEADLAIKKWQGKNVNDLFFKHGKGEFQAKNSNGNKAYIWKSEKREVIEGGDYVEVQSKNKYYPFQQETKTVRINAETVAYQCELRIITSGSGRIKSLTRLNENGECARYFRLPSHERDAIVKSREAAAKM